jgi:hypothetical protein
MRDWHITASPCWAPGTLATIAVATALTAIPVGLHLANMAVGIAACVALALIAANFAAPAIPVALIFSYLFQNLFVSLVSPAIGDGGEFNSIRGYNFVLTSVVWVVFAFKYWTTQARFDSRFRTAMTVSTVGLFAIGFYFVLGLAANPSGAIVYLRNIVTPFLLFQIFAMVGHQHRVSMTKPLIAIACFIEI